MITEFCHICEPTVLLMNKPLSGFGKDPQNIVLFTSLEKVPFKERQLFQACKTNYNLLEWGNHKNFLTNSYLNKITN